MPSHRHPCTPLSTSIFLLSLLFPFLSATTFSTTRDDVDFADLFQSSAPRITITVPSTKNDNTFSFVIKGNIETALLPFSRACVDFYQQETKRSHFACTAGPLVLRRSIYVERVKIGGTPEIQATVKLWIPDVGRGTATTNHRKLSIAPQRLQAMAVARWSEPHPKGMMVYGSRASMRANELREKATNAMLIDRNGDEGKLHISEAENACIDALFDRDENTSYEDVGAATVTTLPREDVEEVLSAMNSIAAKEITEADRLIVPSVFSQVLGERSKYWELLGHWDVMQNSYQLLPEEVATMYALAERKDDNIELQVPGWITLNNATSLPRVLMNQRHGLNALDRFQSQVTLLLQREGGGAEGGGGGGGEGGLSFPYVPHHELHTRMLSSAFYLSYMAIFRSVAPERLSVGRLHLRTLEESRMPTTTLIGTLETEMQPPVMDALTKRTSTLKVAFVSFQLLNTHSIGHLLGRVICQLAFAPTLDVHVIFGGLGDNAIVRKTVQGDIYDCKASISLIVMGVSKMSQVRDTILRESYDVVIYPSVGMDVETSYLSAQRLAPVQAVWWGHPETSGQPKTIDWFLTCDGAEALKSDELKKNNYVEKKIWRMKGMCGGAMADPTNYQRGEYPLVNRRPLTKREEIKELKRSRDMRNEILKEIGLSKTKTKMSKNMTEARALAKIFVCGQPMFKLHPTFFDAVVKEIIHRDVHSHVVLLRGEYDDWTTMLADRLSTNIGQYQRTSGSGEGRIHLIPRRSRIQFIQLMAGADVAMDTFPFGGGVTTLETLAVGTPVVTLPDAKYLRGRFTYHYLSNILNMNELIVNKTVTNERGLQEAVVLYVDKLYTIQQQTKKIRLKILQRKHLLFEVETGRREWMKFLERMRKNVKKTRTKGRQDNNAKKRWRPVPRKKRRL